jgi:hypothetical protein
MTVEAPDLTSYNLLDAAGKLELERRLGLYGDVTTELDTRYKKTYNDRLRAVLSGANTDWLSKPLHAGHGVAGNLRLEGGSEEFRWSATGSWRDTRGAMKGSARQNFNAGITLAYTVDNLIFRNNASVTVNRATNSPYGAFSTYARQQPYNSPRDENGNITRLFDGFYAGISQETGNPLYDATLKSFNKNGYLSLTDNFSIEWHPVEGLRARGSFGITTRNHTSDVFTSAEHSRFTSNTSDDADVFLRRGTYAFTTGNDNSYSGNATVSYTKILADRHQLYAAIDYSMRVNASYAYHFNLEGFSSEEMSFPGNARQYQQDGKPGGLQSRTTSLGVTANVNYTYLRRYYADLSYRVDGSSSFGNERQFAPFWSAGVGWNLHGEKFMERQSLFNSLRLRLSYGITGSQQDMTSALTTYRYDTDNKYMSWTGTTLEGWGNPKLTWQNTGSFNFGLEWSAWDGLFKGDLNVYTRKTNNLLSSLALPASMGFTSHAANIGSVRNSGWELSASAYLARDHAKRFVWIVTGQLVHNTNKILDLSEAVKAQNEAYILAGGDVSTLFYEGRPQSGLYAVRSLGVDPSTGREIFLDRDGAITPTWNAGDKVYLGSKTPLYRGKASTMLQYKGLTFNLALNYYWGGKTYNRTLLEKVEVTTYAIQTGNVDARVLGARWANPGDHTFFPRVSNVATRATSRFVMDDNTLEISSIALQYRWDGRWVRERARVNSINFGLNVSAPDGLVRWSTIKMERGTSYPYAYNMQGSIKLLF